MASLPSERIATCVLSVEPVCIFSSKKEVNFTISPDMYACQAKTLIMLSLLAKFVTDITHSSFKPRKPFWGNNIMFTYLLTGITICIPNVLCQSDQSFYIVASMSLNFRNKMFALLSTACLVPVILNTEE